MFSRSLKFRPNKICARCHHNLPEKSKVFEKFQFPVKTHSLKQLKEDFTIFNQNKTQVTLHGWIDSKIKKISKGLLFATFRDSDDGNLIQLVVNDENLVKKINKYRTEDSVAIKGVIVPKRLKDVDNASQEWDLKVEEVQNLNHSNIVSTHLQDLKATSPFDFPGEYRYLQLRQPVFQNIMKKRSKASNIIRQELLKLDFTEVETPILFKSTPEGAREFLVPTRKKNHFYALPQSPQQYKQLLMASGVAKYFQIARCFRDEDLRADRQPEFTQVDLEMAFATADDVQQVVEGIVKKTWKEIRHLNFFIPKDDDKLVEVDGSQHFPKIDYLEALKNYGVDKPDLRSSLKFTDISEFFNSVENKDFPIVEACVLKNPTEKGFENLVDEKNYKNRIPKILKIGSDNLIEGLKTISFAEINEQKIEDLKALLNLEEGDVIGISTRSELPFENPTPLGRFRQVVLETYPNNWKRKVLDKNGEEIKDINFENVFTGSWIVNFPLFSPAELEESSKERVNYPKYLNDEFVSTHHPFTMFKLEDYEFLQNPEDYLKIKGDHYDLVVNGVELGGGSRRIHDTVLQNFIFKQVLKISNPERLFGHLLKAFELGCPPHSGLAIGFDRMVAMLLGHQSIRNVIPFPKNNSGVDLVVDSPSKVGEKRLKDYHIGVK